MTTSVDPRLMADIKGSEGCRLVAYQDALENWTIGYGHLLDHGIDWEGHTITQDTADELLAQDICEAAASAMHLPEWPLLNICRGNALIELIFNMGLSTWCTFSQTRMALGREDWTDAADDLLHSRWATEVGRDRSLRLAGYIQQGVYP